MSDSLLYQLRMPLALLPIVAIFCLTSFAGTWVDLFNDPESKDWEVNWDGPRNHANAPGEVNIKIEGGYLHFTACLKLPDCGWISQVGFLPADEWENYTVEVKMKILEIGPPPPWDPEATHSPWVGGGLMVHIQGDDVLTRVYLSLAYPSPEYPEGAVLIRSGYLPAQAPPDYKSWNVPYPVEINRWYTLKISTVGTISEFYIDDELIEAIDEDRFTSGRIGLNASDGIFLFDDFVVTGPNIPDGGPDKGQVPVSPKARLTTTWADIKHQR